MIYQIINENFPKLELFNGPASYHRIIPSNSLIEIQELLSFNNLLIIDDSYQPPDDSRLYWTETNFVIANHSANLDIHFNLNTFQTHPKHTPNTSWPTQTNTPTLILN